MMVKRKQGGKGGKTPTRSVASSLIASLVHSMTSPIYQKTAASLHRFNTTCHSTHSAAYEDTDASDFEAEPLSLESSSTIIKRKKTLLKDYERSGKTLLKDYERSGSRRNALAGKENDINHGSVDVLEVGSQQTPLKKVNETCVEIEIGTASGPDVGSSVMQGMMLQGDGHNLVSPSIGHLQTMITGHNNLRPGEAAPPLCIRVIRKWIPNNRENELHFLFVDREAPTQLGQGAYLLKRYIGNYVLGVSKEALNISDWQGSAVDNSSDQRIIGSKHSSELLERKNERYALQKDYGFLIVAAAGRRLCSSSMKKRSSSSFKAWSG
ncbi:LOW QUALITY PROTEIN: hypothetical protein M8C21_030895, partial [Ambrosia artemisiifolia]